MGAFSSLTEKLQQAFGKLTGKGRLSKEDVAAAMKEIRLALLEADVSYKVVKDFISTVQSKAVGAEILESLSPGQQVVDLVHRELVTLLGSESGGLDFAGRKPFIILMAGLQGSGKTTTAAKLGYLLKGSGRKVGFIAADIYRPAAAEQLRTLAGKMSLEAYGEDGANDAPALVARGVEYAGSAGWDTVIIDTAGRIHLDEAMMDELVRIKESVPVHETILVVDGMTGQDAVNIGKEFAEKVGINSLAVTKMDGDARGGAVISLRAVTGAPVKFLGMGEKIDQLEYFHPDRIASRILGMGDVLTLIEKAKAQIDEKEAREMQAKLLESTFTLEDYLSQIRQMRNLGSMEEILSMLPGGAKLKGLKVEEKELGKVEAIILSMTPEERSKPQIIRGGRKVRIAKGSGTMVQDVNRLLKQFEGMKAMMKQIGNKGKKRRGVFPGF